jgi:OsmC-like protein
VVTLWAQGELGEGQVSCSVATGKAMAVAGLHPASGGDGSLACSGDMLLQALVACAGVTLRAVATWLQIPVRAGTVLAEGDLDFRGTLGVSKEAAVRFMSIRLSFDLDTDPRPASLPQCRHQPPVALITPGLLVGPSAAQSGMPVRQGED